MGLVCVLVAEKRGDGIEICHFVLSCRVFGYAIEIAVLDAVRDLGTLPVSGMLVETPFNEPCRAVYADNCFKRDGEHRWTLAADAAPRAAPAWLTVSKDVRPL